MSCSHSAVMKHIREQVKEGTFILVHGVSDVLPLHWKVWYIIASPIRTARNQRENCRKAPWETQAKDVLQSPFPPPGLHLQCFRAQQ